MPLACVFEALLLHKARDNQPQAMSGLPDLFITDDD
jgi:hypothetical protein